MTATLKGPELRVQSVLEKLSQDDQIRNTEHICNQKKFHSQFLSERISLGVLGDLDVIREDLGEFGFG